MELEPCQVKDGQGNTVDAAKAVCPKCQHDQFLILVIKTHNHLQCAKCSESFCQGGCK